MYDVMMYDFEMYDFEMYGVVISRLLDMQMCKF